MSLPLILLSVWAAGLAAAGAWIAARRVGGVGFVWLSAGVVVLVAAAMVGFDGGVGAWISVVGAGVAGAAARRRPRVAVGGLAVAAAGAIVVAGTVDAWLPAVAGAVALGAITGEMLLGHWFLVDPTLPRSVLRVLAVAGAAGAAVDAVVQGVRLASAGAWDFTGVLSLAFVGLAVMTVLLMVGVFFSLREAGYSGVMAATGLSYLAVLTALGAVALPRWLWAGVG